MEISKLIKDRSALFLIHSGIGIDPHQILATDSETFTNLVKSINIAELNPAALKEVCRLALAHNKQELYLQCIEQVKENPQQYNIVEYYVLSLVYKKTDLTIAISELIKDKNQLFVKGPGLKDDPFALLAKDKDAFDALSKKINIADLNPAALKQVYNLALMHNNQELYAKCIDQFKGDAHFIQSIDDLTFCCDNNYVESFKRVFELKQPSKDSCKELFVKALYAEKYEIAAAVLDKFPGIINEKIVTIGDGVPTYPLWVAIHTDNRKRCEFLLEHDANPYVTRPNLNTTLMREALGRPNLLAPFKTHNDAFAAMRMVFPELKKVLEDYPWKLKKTWYQAVDSSKTILLGTQRVPMELESLLSLINAVNSKGSITELKKHMQEVFGAIDNVPVKVMPERLKGDLKKMLSSACPDLQQDLAPPADMVAVTGRFKREVVGGRAEVPLLVEEQQHIHP